MIREGMRWRKEREGRKENREGKKDGRNRR